MPRIDVNKVETLFDMMPLTIQDSVVMQDITPSEPDPLLISAENIADILQNFTEE
jgi:hypothetical protein